MTLYISKTIAIPEHELQLHAIRAQGSGGQNVNKVATAIHLRFDIRNSSLPQDYKDALLQKHDRRISENGIIIIKAQQFRSQEKNKLDALERLAQIIKSAEIQPAKRHATKPSRAARKKRMDHKSKRAQLKKQRKKIIDDL